MPALSRETVEEIMKTYADPCIKWMPSLSVVRELAKASKLHELEIQHMYTAEYHAHGGKADDPWASLPASMGTPRR